MEIKIVPYSDKYASKFKDLNIAWLKKYFYVEAHDKEVLENAKDYIINKGGFIFFALVNNKVAGTVALMNEKEGFELSKMAVVPEFQGHKIGQQLLQYCIDFAKQKDWEKLIIYSSTILENAIYIYRKYGFKEVELEKDSPYQRSNIKMVLYL
ncbi:GNAT family N-acetyltransferase [Aureibaculum sp. 2210JD6-5]|uniref:GNAT family N-acetyltransferase n=1 Tax=Aureibaculum sp. 2210JD6-5 TaxID=3103957 RepID=UPI002AAD1154|nr:GNAT family N-acetyltransferase [Aureibaculum sp. 2210JD6-5]MDY7393943.1 GNAT family N-acetyltransferase [Aureibaculum sp. 2210JD6-5]